MPNHGSLHLRRFLVESNCFGRCFSTKSDVIKPTRGRISSKGCIWLKRTSYVLIGSAGIYLSDKQFNASAFQRNLRTLYTVNHYLAFSLPVQLKTCDIGGCRGCRLQD